MNTDSQTKPDFKLLEERLLEPTTRSSKNDLELMLADNFIEVGSSGLTYNKQQIIQSLTKESQAFSWTLTDFKQSQLASDLVLVTYKAIKKNHSDNKSISSLRSSLWKWVDDRWQIVFHQGTLCAR